jgi:NCS1 family nucleobase:cation symporter-1
MLSAYAAYVAGILINVVGFAGDSTCLLLFRKLFLTRLHSWSRGAPRCHPHLRDVFLYVSTCSRQSRTLTDNGGISGFGVSAIVYYILNQLSPVPGKSTKFVEVDLSTEDVEEVVHDDTKRAKGEDHSIDEKV